jgi:metal-responsive CopG/Arc/MetJ family transcriptional regulator
MPALSLRLSDDLEQRLDQEAQREGVPRSEVVRQAITDFIARREKERFMAEIVSAAKALVETPLAAKESAELTEDSLASDIEAIDKAEAGDQHSTCAEPESPWWK